MNVYNKAFACKIQKQSFEAFKVPGTHNVKQNIITGITVSSRQYPF